MKNRNKTGKLFNAAGFPEKIGLYEPSFEHDSCGIGFVVKLDSIPQHQIIQQGIQVLINLEHRGAIGGDKSTGDGAGLLMHLPDTFFRNEISVLKLPPLGDYGAAMLFLPTAPSLAKRCIDTLERLIEEEDCEVLRWRNVPVNNGCLGSMAKLNEPQIRQLFIHRGKVRQENFERKLYVIRRLAEKEIASWEQVDASQFYVLSMSSRTIVYKGLLTGTQLPKYYLDLNHELFKSGFALVHQRYSTNTLPTWQLAQPFRILAHNGEINTLRGNIMRMKIREPLMKSEIFGADLDKIRPVIVEGGSDSAIFDNVLELLVMAGRSLPHAMMMMIPEAYANRIQMSEDRRAFYEFHSAIMEPWDGPASIIFTDGRYLGGTLDRNGLRPSRYTITRDGIIVMASESGVLQFPGDQIRSRGRLQPGKMFLVDLKQNRIVPDNEIKAKISRQSPYRRWVNDKRIELRGLFMPSQIPPVDREMLLQKQHVFGYTDEDLKMIIDPMAFQGQEPIGSMGNDTALAVLSFRPQLLFSYFKQLFAQVTNPPIDPLREELVMSLESFLGRESNVLCETPDHYRGLKLHHPILTIADMVRIREANHPDILVRDIDMLFPANGAGQALELALENIFQQAEKHISEGATLLILTDRHVDEALAPIPSLLAASGLHHHLICKGLRMSSGIIVETGEAREVIHFALLIGYGVDAICPYLAFQTVRNMAEANMFENSIPAELAMDNYIIAIKKGLLKTFSRMGISTLHSFFGAQIFEAIGLNRQLIDKYFTNTSSRIGGIGLDEIAVETIARHRKGFISSPNVQSMKLLDAGGNYHVRHQGETHLWTPEAIYKLQLATRTNDYQVFKEYSELVDDQSHHRATLRSLFRFKLEMRRPVPIEEVEPVEKIVKRFTSAAMSFGSISREAHETIAIAMNRLGARSNCGEGGEEPARYIPLATGDSRRSRIKQVASGRFGVTLEYLANADEIQIKMAQGAKPGEGGQLPGHKVNAEIALVRHTMPGVTLISPPPHHDIYSIEDLAQLVYDLKAVNPQALISVKLVSEVGVGTIASGVAKAKADIVLISGHDGGTGASPLTAIKHTGLPWELGLAETQQLLVLNKLRDRIRVQVDGQMKTGRDLAIAALLGAEEFGFGTAILITLGCVMMRKCHLNTCPMGVATQDETLRRHFTGKPEYVERFLKFVAQEVREYMAKLGFRTMDEMIGKVELLDVQSTIDHWKAKKLDLSGILYCSRSMMPDREEKPVLHCIHPPDVDHKEALDHELIRLAMPALKKKQPVTIKMPICNVRRTVGATLSSEIVKRFGAKGLPDETITVHFKGSAGQSFGAFLSPGIYFHLQGDANDYLAKGMSGGRIVVVPPEKANFQSHENVIAGNVLLYGATGGEVYINGTVGERFAVRNSGAHAVVEGTGDHACEYMTGGIVVVIGLTGKNFAAGMSGGIAYIYDASELFDTKCNLDMVDLESVWMQDDRIQLREMVEKHYFYTNSLHAKRLLADWETHLPLFVKVMPIDYRKVLERMRLEETTDRETVSATEEVYHG
jgi:glutamate synthase (NADPH/NADH) large chain